MKAYTFGMGDRFGHQGHAQLEAVLAAQAEGTDIDLNQLPTPEEVQAWSSDDFVNALRHDPSHPAYNSHLRQLIHVGYKVAAELGDRFTGALKANESVIARNVTENLDLRHIKPIFG
jgi:hypothetical protein